MKKVNIILVAICIFILNACNSNNQNNENAVTEKTNSTEQISTTIDTTVETTITDDTSESVTTENLLDLDYMEYKDPKIAQIYREVLKSERSFISVVEGNKETTLDNYNYFHGGYDYKTRTFGFSFMDINKDGNFEVVVSFVIAESDATDKEGMILYYEDEKVYGYPLADWIVSSGDNVLWLISIDCPGADITPYYIIPIELRIEDKELKYTYIFKEKGDEDEQWLRDRGMLTDNDDVSYVGDGYDKYKSPEQTRNDGHELKPENIDKYLR